MQGRDPAADQALAQAHDRLLNDDSLQFDRIGFDPPPPPEWFRWLGDLLQAIKLKRIVIQQSIMRLRQSLVGRRISTLHLKSRPSSNSQGILATGLESTAVF